MTQPGSEPAPTPTLSDATPSPEPGPDATPAPAWTEGLSEEQQGFLSNKGWKGTNDMIESYQNLERHMRAPAERQLILPSADAEPEAWGEVWSRLGRPDNAEGYEFETPDLPEGSTDLTPWFREQAFKAGIPKASAESMVQSYGEFAAGEAQKAQEARDVRDESQMVAWQRECGAAYEERYADAQRGAASGLFSPEEITALEKWLGQGVIAKKFAQLGRGMKEASFATGAATGAGGARRTPGEAKAEWKRLKADDGYMKRLRAGDVEAFAKRRELSEQIEPSTEGGPPRTFDPLA